jgi:hypothetical protein
MSLASYYFVSNKSDFTFFDLQKNTAVTVFNAAKYPFMDGLLYFTWCIVFDLGGNFQETKFRWDIKDHMGNIKFILQSLHNFQKCTLLLSLHLYRFHINKLNLFQ